MAQATIPFKSNVRYDALVHLSLLEDMDKEIKIGLAYKLDNENMEENKLEFYLSTING